MPTSIGAMMTAVFVEGQLQDVVPVVSEGTCSDFRLYIILASIHKQ